MTDLPKNKMEQGFSLIELILGMVIGLVVVGGVLNIFIQQNRTNEQQQEVSYAQQNVRAATEIIARDIRNAGYNPSDGAFFPLGELNTSASSIRVRADYSSPSDGDAADTDEDLIYTIDNGNRQLTRNGVALVENVVPNSLQFTYYKADGTTFVPAATQTDMGQIRVVQFQFQVHTTKEDPGFTGGYDLNPAASGTCRVRTLSTSVRIRNVGFEDIE
jgi:type IV pilus assembly protein PilW